MGLKQKNGRDSETSRAFAALRIQNDATVTKKISAKLKAMRIQKKPSKKESFYNDISSLWLIW